MGQRCARRRQVLQDVDRQHQVERSLARGDLLEAAGAHVQPQAVVGERRAGRVRLHAADRVPRLRQVGQRGAEAAADLQDPRAVRQQRHQACGAGASRAPGPQDAARGRARGLVVASVAGPVVVRQLLGGGTCA